MKKMWGINIIGEDLRDFFVRRFLRGFFVGVWIDLLFMNNDKYIRFLVVFLLFIISFC
jgi:hypothetical protein